MAEIVNLRRTRKAKARQAGEAEAAANRAKFGRTKGQKAADVAQRTSADKLIRHSRLDPTPRKP